MLLVLNYLLLLEESHSSFSVIGIDLVDLDGHIMIPVIRETSPSIDGSHGATEDDSCECILGDIKIVPEADSSRCLDLSY